MVVNSKLNLTCAIVLANVLQKEYDDLKISEIKTDENGFYVDFYTKNKISTNDFKNFHKGIKKIISSGSNIDIDNKINEKSLNKFQKAIYKENKENSLIVKIGSNFQTLIFDQPLNNVKHIKFFELTNVGGVYFQNDVNNEQLNRIYGFACEKQNEYDEWKQYLIDVKESDHRKIGAELEIFTFIDMVGQGMPIWLPNGEILKKEIKKVLNYYFEKNNFMFIDTPVLGSKKLYEISGHWDHYKENNFPPIKIDNETFILRPMTCPHHIMVYDQKPHTYKELPLYYCENSKLHRYESSGGLIGLERVRAMELFDSHVFCKLEDIEDVIKKLDSLIKEIHQKLNITIDRVDLSLHDPNNKEKYHNDSKMWNESENKLRSILKKLKCNANEEIGEAAFYGPKIDYQVKTNLGKIITISTIQLDFLLPQKFNINYYDENKEKITPILIHFGVIGTYERFISTLLSQTKGVLPFFLSPKQIVVIPVNNEFHLDYCKKIYETLKENNFRVQLDDSNERLSKKIRNHQTSKVFYQLIIGDNELNKKTISYRIYQKENTETCTLDEFINKIKY